MCDAIFVQEHPFHDDPDVEESSAIRDMRRPLPPISITERWKRISCCPPAGKMMLPFRVAFMLCAFRRVRQNDASFSCCVYALCFQASQAK
jgi:hypothetical protein